MIAFWLHLFFNPYILPNGEVYWRHGGEEIQGPYTTRQACASSFIFMMSGVDLDEHPELAKDPSTQKKVAAKMAEMHMRNAVCVEEDRVSTLIPLSSEIVGLIRGDWELHARPLSSDTPFAIVPRTCLATSG